MCMLEAKSYSLVCSNDNQIETNFKSISKASIEEIKFEE